MKTHIMSEACK